LELTKKNNSGLWKSPAKRYHDFGRCIMQTIQRPKIKNKLNVLILATPRTGSAYFCNMLVKRLKMEGLTNLDLRFALGYEVFEPSRLYKFLDTVQLDFEEYFLEISQQEIFMVKCHLDHLLFWKKLGHNIFERFDLICYLERGDSMAQSKSHAIAAKTGCFTSRTGSLASDVWGSKYVMEREGIEIPHIDEDKIYRYTTKRLNLIDEADAYLKQVKHVYQFESFTRSDDQIIEFSELVKKEYRKK
jgi:hypothetical protein